MDIPKSGEPRGTQMDGAFSSSLLRSATSAGLPLELVRRLF